MKQHIAFFIILIFCFSCSEKGLIENKNKVRVRIKRFPNTLNYLTSTSSQSSIVQRHLFNSLFSFDEKENPAPLLIEKLPSVVKKNMGFLLKFDLRKEAFWSNGEKITSKDVLFSVKVFKLPVSVNINTRSHLKPIKSVNIENEASFSMHILGAKQDVINLSGDFVILQKSKFDSEDMLGHISLEKIENHPDLVAKDTKVKTFVNDFLKNNFKFNGDFLEGSGPYKIIGLESGKYIRLKRKKNWWGNKLERGPAQFSTNPEEIIYICIPEPLVAVQALKTQNIDVMHDIPSSEFVQLQKDPSFIKNFNLFAPLKYKFTYIGLNSRIKYLSNIDLRKAIANLVKPVDIIKVVEKGFGQGTIGPVNPANEYFYNHSIIPRSHNLQLAQKVFLENGFKLFEGKLINKKTEKQLEFNVAYRQNPSYESIAELLKEEASKIGIKLNLKQYEGRAMSKMSRNQKFEITIGSFSANSRSLNFNGLFSTEASKIGGMNFTGFGSAKSDSLIQAANYAQDSVSKRQALWGLQEELHNEATMLFLYFSKNKIAINKKFTNLKISATKPGYDVTSFKLKEPEEVN